MAIDTSKIQDLINDISHSARNGSQFDTLLDNLLMAAQRVGTEDRARLFDALYEDNTRRALMVARKQFENYAAKIAETEPEDVVEAQACIAGIDELLKHLD